MKYIALLVSAALATPGRDCTAQSKLKTDTAYAQICNFGECCATAYKSTADNNVAKDGTTRNICIKYGDKHYVEVMTDEIYNSLSTAEKAVYTYTLTTDANKEASYVAYCVSTNDSGKLMASVAVAAMSLFASHF